MDRKYSNEQQLKSFHLQLIIPLSHTLEVLALKVKISLSFTLPGFQILTTQLDG